MPEPIDELREAVGGLPSAPGELSSLLAKVRDCAYTVTDADVEAAREALGSDDAVFEQLVRAAAAEGFRRLDRARDLLG
jgi:hypothetical protein